MKLSRKSGWFFLCLALLAVLMVSSVHQAVSATEGDIGTLAQAKVDKPEPAPAATPKASPEVPPKDGGKDGGKNNVKIDDKMLDVIIIYALILALLIALPTITDIILAYRSRNKNLQLLLDKASQDNLTEAELEALIKAASGGPPGIAGMSRSLMAFAVIIILGIAMFHLLAFCNSCNNQETNKIVSNVLSMLGATLASITGFYFGGRSVEEKSKAKEEEKAAKPTGKEPKPESQEQK